MREKLIELLHANEFIIRAWGCSYEEAADRLIANGVTIPVRCKDCKYYEIHRPKVLENCERNGYLIPVSPDDFCSYGEIRSMQG